MSYDMSQIFYNPQIFPFFSEEIQVLLEQYLVHCSVQILPRENSILAHQLGVEIVQTSTVLTLTMLQNTANKIIEINSKDF